MRYETIATLAGETYLITPLEEGQALYFNGIRHTAPAGEPIRVYGTGPVEISQGKWGNRLRVAGEYNGPYFDGSFSPDPDLTPEWTGAVNASASILTGVQAQAFSGGSGRVTIQSSTGVVSGVRALRVLRTGTESQAAGGAQWGFTTADLGKTFTVAAWCTIPEGYNPSQDVVVSSSVSRGIYLLNNTVGRTQSPSTPGTHLVRAILTPAETTQTLRLGGGGLLGQSVYWDDLTIVEGEHPDLMPFGQASSASAVLTPATGKRASVTILSGDATHVTLTTTAGVGQLRLTEGTHTGFMVGDGVPPVEILDPQETLQRVIAGDHRSDFTITVKELG